jgi:hypothetical protein
MGDAENTAQERERITVALVPRAAADLERLRERTRLSKTDLVNRAITLYEFASGQAAAGSAVLIRAADGTVSEVRFL